MTKKFNTNGLVGSQLPKLDVDLTFPSDLLDQAAYKQIDGIDASSGLTTALSLTGKFAIAHLSFINMLAESQTFKLTIDGVVIMNDTFVGQADQLIVGDASNTTRDNIIIQCDESLLLEVQTTTDTSITLNYVARPIL